MNATPSTPSATVDLATVDLATVDLATVLTPPYTVLQIPVPGLESFVRDRLQAWAPDFLRVDGGVHAHITVLAPFLAEAALTPRVLDAVGALVGQVPRFSAICRGLGCFPDGLVFARPEPARPFRLLTRLIEQGWPIVRPYGGLKTPVPHVSLDYLADGRLDAARARWRHEDVLAHAPWAQEITLPIEFEVAAVELVRYVPGDTQAMARFDFGEKS